MSCDTVDVIEMQDSDGEMFRIVAITIAGQVQLMLDVKSPPLMLTIPMVKALMPHLKSFIKTGKLKEVIK